MNWPPDKPAPLPVTAPLGKRAVNDADYANNQDCLRLEIGAQTLLRLIASGQLCASDFRCLDCESKHCVWRLLLMSCKETLHIDSGCGGRCSECGEGRKRHMDEGPKLTIPILAEAWPELLAHEPHNLQAGTGDEDEL